MSPMSRSLKHLRERGYKVEIVEYWNHFAKRRKDLFNFADILGVKEGSTIAAQTTTTGNLSARVKKIQENEFYPICKEAGWIIEAHGWALRGKQGERKQWTLKTVIL
jgi:hypothetical protein